MMPHVRCPVGVLWGQQDGVTAIEGPVGKYFRRLAQEEGSNVQFTVLPNANHCPQDEGGATTEAVNEGILRFVEALNR